MVPRMCGVPSNAGNILWPRCGLIHMRQPQHPIIIFPNSTKSYFNQAATVPIAFPTAVATAVPAAVCIIHGMTVFPLLVVG